MASEPSSSVMFTNVYTCFADLSKLPKNRVIIRNRKAEYSALCNIVMDLLKREPRELIPVKNIHEKLDGVLCISCCRHLKKYSDAVKAIEPIQIR